VKKKPVLVRQEEDPRDWIPIRAPIPFLEKLEARLEVGFLIPRFPHKSPGTSLIPSDLGENPCGCLGTLCHCDGHDCVGICDCHCVLDYT
jgi:hypothetical protein